MPLCDECIIQLSIAIYLAELLIRPRASSLLFRMCNVCQPILLVGWLAKIEFMKTYYIRSQIQIDISFKLNTLKCFSTVFMLDKFYLKPSLIQM